MARAKSKDKRGWLDCLQCWDGRTNPVKVPPGEECRRCGARAVEHDVANVHDGKGSAQ